MNCYTLPTEITIDNKSFKIRNNGDFRVILDCFEALQDETISRNERVLASLIIFYDELTTIDSINRLGNVDEAVQKMYEFFNCGQPQSQGLKLNYKIIDWEKDAQLISTAINSVSHKEIRAEPYVHWFTFMGYYMAIGEDDGAYSAIIQIRHKIATGKKLEKYEQRFRIENPQFFDIDMRTTQQREDDEIIRKLWEQNN